MRLVTFETYNMNEDKYGFDMENVYDVFDIWVKENFYKKNV